MNRSGYRAKLEELSQAMEQVPNTPMGMYFKVVNLAILNMRYERIAFNRELARHPFELVEQILADQVVSFRAATDVLFIEGPDAGVVVGGKQASLEPKHQSLFNAIWNQYDAAAYEVYVERYRHRIRVNHLESLVKGKRCLDMGCGNGNFCFALLDLGASFVAGIDFGADSVAFAEKRRLERPDADKAAFKVNTVYEVDFPDGSFDLVIQNGVFHHLDDEDRAIREARRLLAPGGYLWYYTDGEGGLSYELWDRSVHLLREVPITFARSVLQGMNVGVNKLVHLMDGLNATYRHTSWDKVTAQLARGGFGEFRRLTGGFDTDFDLDVIERDPYGRDKFGEGDLRVLARAV
jgi:ubiquinone/menaquinone biosynthesis C-methylase UbiE